MWQLTSRDANDGCRCERRYTLAEARLLARSVTYLLPFVMVDLLEYELETGRSPFGEWFATLDAQAASKITTAMARLEAGNLGDVKSVGEGVLERRISFGPGYRVYFGQDGHALVILLIGGTKKRQQQDIAQAKAYWQDYKQRKKAG